MKVESRWNVSYIMQMVHHHGTIDIEIPNNSNIFRVDERRLKPILKSQSS